LEALLGVGKGKGEKMTLWVQLEDTHQRYTNDIRRQTIPEKSSVMNGTELHIAASGRKLLKDLHFNDSDSHNVALIFK